MRRISVLFLALGCALLAACGASIEQAMEPAALAQVDAQPPGAPEKTLRLAVDGDGRHAYLHRLGGNDYVSLGESGQHGDSQPLKVVARKAHAIRLLAADPAQARAILRSLKLPANQRKLWMGEEIVLDAASYDMLMAVRSKGKPQFAEQMEMRLVRLEK